MAMETADMSIMLGNDSVVHHPMNHLKKMINESGSDAHLDSGYASTASISYNLTDASVSTSMKKSLEPIAENYEATFNEASHVSVIETPTTRSMRQLSEFHIQTPQNDKRKQEMTPTKANYLYNVSRSGHKSSTKENRNSASPYKTTPNKTYGSSTNYRSFTQKINSASATKNRHIGLYDSTDIDDSFEMSVNEPSIECSPIAVHSKSLNSPAPTMHDSKRRTLQRHPSGIESSTPISRAIKRTHTQSVVKTHFNEDSVASTRHLLRKTQSFSPAKRVLREITNPCQTLERHDEQLEEDDAVATKEYNPARKMLAFASNQFQTLLTGNASVAQMPGQARPSGKAPTIAPTITPTKLARTTRQSTLQRQERFSFSPSPTIASPTRNDVAKQSIQEDAMRRPKKKMERSTSYNPTPPKESCIEKEQRKKFIHCTPPKSYRRKPLKRSAASAIGDDSTAGGDTSEPPAKRKLFYDGLEKLDIFGRLKNHTVVTDLILSMLSDEDLHASYQVCPSWSQIIQKRKLEYSRLLKYTRHLHRQKENANMRATSFEPEPSVATNVKRKPFEQRNLHYSLRSSPRRSPPVSPSKRKFHENQKAVKKLKPGQKLTTCPRCNQNTAIVHAASEPLPSSPSPRKLKPSVLFARRKGFSCPMPGTSNAALAASTKAWKSFDERKKSDPVISEYAECLRIGCRYSFCTKCRCDRHIDSVCPSRPISSSPTSDEDSISRPSDRRNSRRNNLRRLLN